MAGRGRKDTGRTIIVLRRVEESRRGHHSGAWKVAYADFVTAMMAFFLLLWLLNSTSEEQRRGIADFFSPVNAMGQSTSGSGLPFAGRTPSTNGRMASDSGAIRVERGPAPVRFDLEEEPDGEAPNPGQGEGTLPGPGQPAAYAREAAEEADAAGPGGEAPGADAVNQEDATPRAGALPDPALRAELERRERRALEQAAEELRAAVQDDPALAELARQLTVEVVPEGLRIQLLDAERRPMFPSGSAVPNDRARGLLQKVAQVAAKLPNALAIAGHTDAAPFRGGERSNWELSAERANAVRRLLTDSGIAEARIRSVTGHAARVPLLPDQPMAAANRRVAITLLRDLPEKDGGEATPQ